MKAIKLLFCFYFIPLFITPVNATIRRQPISYRIPVYAGPQLTYQYKTDQVEFQMEVVSDNDGVKPEEIHQGRAFIYGEKGESYSIRLHNPLPVRVAVNLTVDGLNTISGKPQGILGGSKWIIEPNSFITIPGWQVNQNETRRFFFEDKRKSYAAWQGEQMNKNLQENCGVIGAAYFWNKKELTDYYEQHPLYYFGNPLIYKERGMAQSKKSSDLKMEENGKKMPSDKDKLSSGTGMGERESHPTVQVEFRFDTGMFRTDEAIVLYYNFKRTPKPNPFPSVEFAPEMPS